VNPSPTPYNHPFSQTGGSQPPVKTCATNCDQTVPDTMAVWEHTAYGNIPLPCPAGPCRPPTPKRGRSQNEIQNCCKIITYLKYCIHDLYELNDATNSRPHRGTSSPNLEKINMPSIGCIVGFPYLLVNIVLVCVVLLILVLSGLDALVLYVNHINVTNVIG